MRTGALAALALVLVAAPSASADSDFVLSGGPRSKGTILMAHPGSFLYGSPRVSTEKSLGRRFRRAGFDVRGLAYPLADYPAAVAYAARAARRARRRGPVFVVGQSAGGALAAELVVRRLVDGAVLVAALTDFRTIPLEPQALRYYLATIQVEDPWRSSPIRRFTRRRRPPVYAFHSPDDPIVPFAQAQALSRFSGVRLRRLSTGHVKDRSWVPRAGRWLSRLSRARARGSSAPSPRRSR
jgi:acetyl esterase/lipase